MSSTTGTKAALGHPAPAPVDARPVLVIPAYCPAESLPAMVAELMNSGTFQAAVIVDDGSGPSSAGIFDTVSKLERVHLLRHAVNLGKGAALKAGFNSVACRFPGSVGALAADADGQHAVCDVLRAAEEMIRNGNHLILGCRRFDGDVPLRSRIGNTLTRVIMRLVTGQRISDTQTGLRGVPMALIPTLLRLRTTGYDFELDMLVRSRDTGTEVREVPIETIYFNGNRCSHFNPLLDSMRVYFVFARFAAVSVLTAGLDNLVFVCAMAIWPHLAASQVVARLVAGLFNYYSNKQRVFHSRERHRVALPRYWLSVLAFGFLSYLLIRLLMAWTSLGTVAAKLTAETLMFVFSFAVQRDFVFTDRPPNGKTT